MATLVFILGSASLSSGAERAEKAEKCAACRKGDKALDKITEKKKSKTTADFMKTVKEDPSAKMRAKFTDDDLRAAAKSLKLAEK